MICCQFLVQIIFLLRYTVVMDKRYLSRFTSIRCTCASINTYFFVFEAFIYTEFHSQSNSPFKLEY